MARKRGWKGYWVCLKGTTLLFYPCDSREGRSVEAAPKHLIIVDGAIMQPIPEHPKRDYIFCLSTAFGDAYLFQAPCQVSLRLETKALLYEYKTVAAFLKILSRVSCRCSKCHRWWHQVPICMKFTYAQQVYIRYTRTMAHQRARGAHKLRMLTHLTPLGLVGVRLGFRG